MKAVDKFEYRRGYKFDLCDVVDPSGDHPLDRRSGRTIRIPVHMIETINKLVRTGRQMLYEIGCEPTPNWPKAVNAAREGPQGDENRSC